MTADRRQTAGDRGFPATVLKTIAEPPDLRQVSRYIRLVTKPHGDTMKKILAATLALTIAAPAFAGGIAPVVIEPEVIIEETGTSSANGIIVPLMFLLLVAAAVASSGD